MLSTITTGEGSMRPPHVRRHWKQFDWKAIEAHVTALMPMAESIFNEFLKIDKRWGGSIKLEEAPPSILISFYLKPDAYPRKRLVSDDGDDIGPPRIALIPEEDLDIASELVAAILRATTKMKAHLWKNSGYLDYKLKVSDPKLFPKRVPVLKTRNELTTKRMLSKQDDVVLLEPIGTSAETAAEIRLSMQGRG